MLHSTSYFWFYCSSVNFISVYDLVQSLNNKTVGIEVYFRRKLIGSINIGLLDDDWLNDYPDDEYYQLIGKNPFIHNVAIIDEFQKLFFKGQSQFGTALCYFL